MSAHSSYRFVQAMIFSLYSFKNHFVKTCIEGGGRGDRRCQLHPLRLRWVDVSGQHHAPAASSPRKNSGYPQFMWMFTVTCNTLLCDRTHSCSCPDDDLYSGSKLVDR